VSVAAEPRVISFGAAITEALEIALASHPKVFLLGEDIADPSGGVYGITKGLSTKFGTHRVRQTPIAEQAIIGAAVGAAIAGYRPVAEIMIMDFLAAGLDQLSNHAAKMRYVSGGRTRVPMVIRTAAGAGMGLGAQHGELLEAWLVHTPGLKVVFPSTPADAKGLLLTSILDDDDPVVFVEQTMLYRSAAFAAAVHEGDVRVPLGKAVVRRPGRDVSLISYGKQVHDCLAVAEALAADGIDAEVVDLRTLVPCDEAAVMTSVAKTKNAVVVHEAVTRCGFGAELSSRIHEELFSDLEHPVQRVGAKNTPVPYAENLEAAFVPSPADITAAVRKLTG